ncbi:UNVERIFIED_CONTAM: hypothetical protein FKN15_000515 [Acipenser sinensis]
MEYHYKVHHLSRIFIPVLAASIILNYLNVKNRPYSAQDVFGNLQKQHGLGKTAVVKAMELLAQQGKIREKVYGKQKIYFADQSQFTDVSDTELKSMDGKISELNSQIQGVQQDCRQLDAELRGLNSSMTTKELISEIEELKKECVESKQRLERIKNATNHTNDIMDAVLEGYPKSKKQFSAVSLLSARKIVSAIFLPAQSAPFKTQRHSQLGLRFHQKDCFNVTAALQLFYTGASQTMVTTATPQRVTTGSAASIILNYLNVKNRPYSAQDVFGNLQKQHGLGKTAVVKAMELLAQQGKIREKVYGKQKIYFADQSQFTDVSDTELKSMDGKISELNSQIQGVQQDCRQLDAELRGLNSSMTTKELISEIEELKKECVESKQRLERIKNATNHTNDIMDAVLEGYPKSKKQFSEEVGIETDEDCKVTVPNV